MKSTALVSVNLIHALHKFAESKGINMTDIFGATEFQVVDFNNPEARIPAKQFNALWEILAREIDDPHLGLHFAKMSHTHPAGDVLTAVLYNCPTVGKAMEKLARYHDLTTDLVQLKIHSDGVNTAYTWESSFHTFAHNRHFAEAVMGWLFFTLVNLSQKEMPIAEIQFRHTKPADISEHQRIFKCPLRFSQTHDHIVIRNEDLASPIPLANPKLLHRLEAIIQQQLEDLYAANTWADQTTRLISEMLLNGQKPDVSAVAQKLAVSTRHLQNKLKDEDVTYRELSDQVRKEMAIRYLREPMVRRRAKITSHFETAELIGVWFDSVVPGRQEIVWMKI